MTKHNLQRDFRLKEKLKLVARQMRHESTKTEALLWQRLRDRQLGGYRFRRQYIIDRFIVDFICPNAALIIEVDGNVHSQQVEADQEREQILTDLGFRVLRFSNIQVLKETDQVVCKILDTLAGTPSLFSGFDENGEGVGG